MRKEVMALKIEATANVRPPNKKTLAYLQLVSRTIIVVSICAAIIVLSICAVIVLTIYTTYLGG